MRWSVKPVQVGSTPTLWIHISSMTTEEKLNNIISIGEEVIGLEEIRAKLQDGKKLIAYDGFEPSGNIHIAQGLLKSLTIQKLIQNDVHFKMLVADWYAFANNKLGGDMEKIKTTGRYFIEVWKACGLDTNKVEFIWTSDMVKDPSYWAQVLRIAKATTLKRVIRCSQIMGRNETDTLSAAQIMYPIMQTNDIFYLEADIAQLGMDQRKVNMLARQIADELKLPKPAAIHHHMLMSLRPSIEDVSTDKIDRVIAMKMSKSKPEGAIFMTDTDTEVAHKIKNAYCPPESEIDNPVLEYFKYIVFMKHNSIEIQREEKFGGNLSINSYQELAEKYIKGEIYSLDLKSNLTRYINEMLEPVRKHFRENPTAKKLLEEVASFSITR